MKAMAEKSLVSDWQMILMPPLFLLFQQISDDSTLQRHKHTIPPQISFSFTCFSNDEEQREQKEPLHEFQLYYAFTVFEFSQSPACHWLYFYHNFCSLKYTFLEFVISLKRNVSLKRLGHNSSICLCGSFSKVGICLIQPPPLQLYLDFYCLSHCMTPGVKSSKNATISSFNTEIIQPCLEQAQKKAGRESCCIAFTSIVNISFQLQVIRTDYTLSGHHLSKMVDRRNGKEIPRHDVGCLVQKYSKIVKMPCLII